MYSSFSLIPGNKVHLTRCAALAFRAWLRSTRPFRSFDLLPRSSSISVSSHFRTFRDLLRRFLDLPLTLFQRIFTPSFFRLQHLPFELFSRFIISWPSPRPCLFLFFHIPSASFPFFNNGVHWRVVLRAALCLLRMYSSCDLRPFLLHC